MRNILLKRLLFGLILVGHSFYSYSQTTLFSESFDEAAGSITGVSAEGVAWGATCPGCVAGDIFAVNAVGAFEGIDLNGPAVWKTNPIDVSNCVSYEFETVYAGSEYGPVLESNTSCLTCAGDVNSPNTGDCNNCWDFVNFELFLDGSVADSELIGTTETPSFATINLEACNTNASTAVLQVTMQNNRSDEIQRLLSVALICYEEFELTGNRAVCEGTDFNEPYSVTPLIAGSSYLWSTTGGAPQPLNGNPVYGINWENAALGNYTVSVDVTDPLGCVTTITRDIDVIPSAPQAIVCNTFVNMTMDSDCSLSTLRADMFLEGMEYTNDAYTISLKDADGNLVDPADSEDYIGQTLEVEVTAKCGGNSCWGYLTLEDKSIPPLACSPLEIINCEDLDSDLGFPTNVGTPTQNSDGSFTVFGYDNCGDGTLTMSDETKASLCSDPLYSSIVERTWVITDSRGNTSSCVTEIRILKATLADLSFPAHYDPAYGTSALDACGNWPKLDSGLPSPDGIGGTGRPTGTFCLNVHVSYFDIVFDGDCDVEFKILRKWKVEDICNGDVQEYTQNILVEIPLNGFVVTCPPQLVIDQVFTNDIYNCTADWDVLNPVVIASTCMDYTISISYKIGDGTLEPPPGTVFETTNLVQNSDGSYTIHDLPIGFHWVKYTFESECGHVRTCTADFEVVDNSPPHAVCDLHSNIALNSDGCAYATFETFDDGSFACASDVELKIRRLTSSQCSGTGSQTSFRDQIKFCCSDANKTVKIELRATANGQTNSCIVEAFIQDFSTSSFNEPSNRTVSLDCNAIVNLNNQASLESNFGAPTFTSSLCGASWTEVLPATMTRDECGKGQIRRNWRYYNQSGTLITESQTIAILLNNPFDINDISWPGEVSVSGCVSTELLPDDVPGTGNQRPTWTYTDCSNVITNYKDLPFYDFDGVCLKILRTWTVVDWCQVDGTPGKGTWERTQVIKINDNVDPVITSGCVLPSIVTGEDIPCGQRVDFTATASDNCMEDLKWSATLNGFNRTVVVVDGEAQLNNMNVYDGSNEICWTVTDACGNSDSCCETFLIKEDKPPSPACVSELVIVISNSTNPSLIWASDFDASSTDNCTDDEDLRFAFSTNPNNTSMAIDCNDLPSGVIDTMEVRVYVFDDENNYDFCTAMLIIQDNGDYCTDVIAPRINLAGEVMSESHEMLDEVMITVSSNSISNFPLNDMAYDGQYAFNDLEMYHDYTLTAQKDIDYLNGVSTLDLVLIQKHLLSIQELDSPYKLIAADVNNSGSLSAIDLVELRKLILGIYTALPSNESWRFVNSKQQFADVTDPFPFDESVHYSSLDLNVHDANFIAVKIGDVNQTAELSANSSTASNRSVDMILDISIKKEENALTRIEFIPSQQELIYGIQFSAAFDKEAMSFVGIESDVLNVTEANYAISDKGLITFSWSEAEAVALYENEAILTFLFDVQSDDVNLQIVSGITEAELYVKEGNTIVTKGIELRNASADFVVYQNVPNPFNANTVIGFELPEASEVKLTIYDATGKVIFAKTDEYSKGYNKIIIDGNNLTNSGILYYQIDSYTHSATKKMIVLK